MYWFFNCNNYNADAVKVLVYSAYIHNPHFKPVCVWDDSRLELKQWLEDRGVLVYNYRSSLSEMISKLRHKEDFLYEARGCTPFGSGDEALNGMWTKADIPKVCELLKIEDKFVLATDPDCMFMSEYDLELEWPNAYAAVAAGPEEEPYREWISGGIYVFNVKRCLEDREDFWDFVIKNYREIGYAENLAYMDFYSYQHIVHIPPDWNYKPYWEREKDYLISPADRAIFKATPKLIHFQGQYKPWDNPPMPENTWMEHYCELWHNFLKLSEASFKFKS